MKLKDFLFKTKTCVSMAEAKRRVMSGKVLLNMNIADLNSLHADLSFGDIIQIDKVEYTFEDEESLEATLNKEHAYKAE